MLKIWLLSLLSLSDTTIHYKQLYNGNQEFSTANNLDSTLGEYGDLNQCFSHCSSNSTCLGVYENLDEDYCSTLNDLGYYLESSTNSNSYTKVNHYKYPLENHSLVGEILDSNIFNGQNYYYNSTIYLDLNHNGVLDIGEPFTEVGNEEEFYFDNVPSGTYLVRQIAPPQCIQLFPGLNGSFILYENNVLGDGYVDNAIRYHHTNHKNRIFGGIVNSSYTIQVPNISYIIGNDMSTYMSFYNGDSIILTFNDESVVNKEGYDIFFNLYGSSHGYANVSVSYDEMSYTQIGELNVMNTYFDLETIGYESPVNFIKLDFYNELKKESLDIVSVGIFNHSEYLPTFAYSISVPYSDTLLFVNDCNYDFPCGFYCDFNIFDDSDFWSCYNGCQIFEDNKNCNCSAYYDDDDFISGFTVDEAYCKHGCEYAIQQYIYPNYTLFTNMDGFHESNIQNVNECGETCLDSLLETCSSNLECRSLSFDYDEITHGHLYVNDRHHIERDTMFLIKNNYMTTTTLTSTTATLTSTTATLTSTTATSTSTTASLTSTTATLTSTTATSTSTTATSSSTTATSTSTTATSTSTTATSSSTTATETSISSTQTNTTTGGIIDGESSKSKSNSNKLSEYNKSMIAVVVICSLIFVGIVGFGIYKKTRRRFVHVQRTIDSVENPVYDPSFIADASHYQDLNPSRNIKVDEMYTDYDYMEVE